jgi:cytoskeletal protein RodZ
MSTASPALPGKPSFGGLLARIIFIVVLWAALVAGTLHYVGYAWPKAYQISQAEKAQAEEQEMTALNPPASPTPVAAAPAASATPATATTAAPSATPAATTPASSAAPAAASPADSSAPAAPATSAAPATAAPAAASAPKAATGEQKLPFDIRLAGYNRTALENVSIFFSIVISVLCVGSIILQIFKYKQTET